MSVSGSGAHFEPVDPDESVHTRRPASTDRFCRSLICRRWGRGQHFGGPRAAGPLSWPQESGRPAVREELGTRNSLRPDLETAIYQREWSG